MKRLFTMLALVLTGGAAAIGQTMDTDGHQLTALWGLYDDAHKADLPQKEAEILSQIKQEAAARRMAVDFYDAATEYVNVVQRRDWKQREGALKTLAEEVKSFDEPIVTVLWMSEYQNAATDYQWAYVRDNLDRFQGRNTPFYRNIGAYLGGSLAPFIRSDKEYVLWRLLQRRSYYSIENDEIYQTLKKEVAGQYPAQPALEYYVLGTKNRDSDQLPQRIAALKAFESAYAGKSVSMFARGDLLKIRMDQLEKDKASSADFETLYKDCEAFEQERAAFTGDEARIVRGYVGVKALGERLTAQSLEVSVNQQQISIVFQNLKKAKVELFDGRSDKQKRMKSWKLKNPIGSFYVRDTATIALPVLSDGHYLVQASYGENISAQADYNQYTLSIAVRNTGSGWQVYVADHKTGEPLDKVTLRLFRGGRQLASASVKLDGFTPLPKAIVKKINAKSNAYYDLVAESGKRSSTEVGLSGRYYYGGDFSGVNCHIYRDRGAYNPGDTLRFKAVVYKGNPRQSFTVVPKKKLQVVLRDSEHKEVDSKDLVTNEFGSISGEFVLPNGLRNGTFTLGVREQDGRHLGTVYFRVDEFVLPTFDLSFDTRKELYLVGDQVPVSGKLESYSGHSLTGARVNLKVMCDNVLVLDQEEPVKADNTFAFTFQAREPGYYQVEAIVTDATGEMRSFRDYCYIGNRIQVNLDVQNGADGSFVLPSDESEYVPYRTVGGPYHRTAGQYVLDQDKLEVRLSVCDADGNRVPLSLDYVLLDSQGKVQREGKAESGDLVEVDLDGLPSGLYRLRASAKTKDHRSDEMLQDSRDALLLVTRPGDSELTPLVKRMHVSGPSTVKDGKIAVRMGATYGPAYVVATLFGEDKKELATRRYVFAKGVPSEVAFDYADSYPDAVRLQLFYFMDGESVSVERQYRRERSKLFLPLKFSRFHSDAYPHTEYLFTLKTHPGVEALAAAWDKSLDAIAANPWPVVNMLDYSVEAVGISATPGHITGEKGREPIPHVKMSRRLGAAGVAESDMLYDEMALAEPAMARSNIAFKSATQEESADDAGAAGPAPVVRTDFASVLTFQPHLHASDDGTLEFSIRTSDKLSTYYVAVYAHGKDMRNALVQEEMVVSLPVKVALVQPQFLYAGDRYEAALSVSSISDSPVSGRLQLRYGDSMQEVPVTVPARGVVSQRFLVVVPEGDPESEEITLTASFLADAFSDAVQVKVPVYPAAQVLTEAHSAVLLSGMSREALLQELRGRFVNVPGADAQLREITVLDMVKDAIPGKVEPAGKDVLSLSEAWYVRLLAGKLSGSVSPEMSTEELVKKMMACQNADGGFGWFEGMSSSAIITAVMLERFAKLRDRGFEVPEGAGKAVRFLDKTVFGTSFPVWRGWVTDSQYVYVRSFYPEVSFDIKPVTKADKKRLADFQEWAKDYLTPSKKDGRGLQGQILAKARRLLTLENLGGTDAGVVLSQAWGITLEDSKGTLRRSMQADISSLLQYAVAHRDGGWYYPNAVMPWRGLLESEAYTHALLCDLMSRVVESGQTAAYSEIEQARTVSNGIRIWLMLQKETQKWETDPAYIDAVTSILDGPASVLDTRVLALSATYKAPFSRIKAAGNGFTIGRKFYRMGSQELLYDDTTSDVNKIVATMQEIKPGDPVKVGEKILVRYEIWNAENRSFVKLEAGREAALRPVQQLSGHLGWGYIRPSRGSFSYVPQGYRNVKSDRTEFFFDSYPEEKSTLSEEFFVTQAGAFVAPVVTIESLYAPHYRANSASRGVLESLGQ